jgi:beta-lactamase regulating signal transducer with metallopeptidase domain
MSWLLIVGLKNAIFVAPLALLALGIGRYSKRPALAHVLWLIVLVKLLTPPLVDVPVGWVPDGWRLDVESLVAAQPAAPEVTAIQSVKKLDLTCPAPVKEVVADTPGVDAAPTVNAAVCDTPSSSKVSVTHRPAAARQASWVRSSAVWMGLACLIWLTGSAVATVLLVVRAWRFHRFVRLAARIDDSLAARVATLAASVGLGHGPRVVVVEGVVSPMLWGVGSGTRLVFPAKLADRLNGAEIDSLLLHELAHYARGDHWVRLLELAAHVLYWWHPVVWFARREIEAAEEQCCDAWVIQHQHGSRRSYAEALLTTIDFLCEPQTALPPAACGLGEVPLLRTRLKQIMKGHLAAGLSRGVRALVLSAGVIISPLQPALWATSSPARPKINRVARAPSTENVLPPAAPASPADSTTSSTPAPQPEKAATETISPPRIASSPLRWSALSPDGNYRLESRRTQTTLVDERTRQRLDLTYHQITCASFAPDSRNFVTGHDDGTVRLFDCNGGLRERYQPSSGPIKSVAFGPDNKVAVGSIDGSVTILDWALGTETQLTGLTPVACVRWSPGGDRLAIGLGNWTEMEQGGVMVWDGKSSVKPEQLSLPQPVGALDWLDEGSILIGRWDGQGQVFQPATGEVASPVRLDKTAVSAANWSPDCPLVPQWQAQELALGAAR